MSVEIYGLKDFIFSVVIILLGKEFFELIDNKKSYMVEYRKVNERCLSNFTTKAN